MPVVRKIAKEGLGAIIIRSFTLRILLSIALTRQSSITGVEGTRRWGGRQELFMVMPRGSTVGLGCPAQVQELLSMILVGPFQVSTFPASVILPGNGLKIAFQK